MKNITRYNMHILNKLMLFMLFSLSATGISVAQNTPDTMSDNTITFTFRQMDDSFYRAGNETKLAKLYAVVDKYRAEILSGKIPLSVSGYCTSAGSDKENLRIAVIRSNRVKSELITNKGLTEDNFVTKNHTTVYKGHTDIVIVTLHIPLEKVTTEPERKQPEPPTVEKHNDIEQEQPKQPEPVAGQETDSPTLVTNQTISNSRKEDSSRRYFAVKTNLVPWVGTIPNVAAELQVSNRISVELPLMWCPWKISDRRSIKAFALQPEARWWLSVPGEGHFFGVHAHVAWYNVRWGDDRYQDAGRPLMGGGISYGYILPFNDRWAGEFTLGAGYANMRYNRYYNISNGARIDTHIRNYWGITRVGISLVYRFSLNK